MLIDSMESMDLFNTFDLTHWAAWGDFCQPGNTNIIYQVGVNVLFLVTQQVKEVK